VKTNSWGKKPTIKAAAQALLLLCVACGGSNGGVDRAAVGTSAIPLGPAVDFAFDSLDDRPVSAEAMRGKPTVVAFVTTGSLPAQAQVGFLVAMARNDAQRVNYVVVALEARENRELVELYAKSLSIPFPVALADNQTRSGSGAFGDVTSVPVTLLLDRSGRVIWRVGGRVAKSEEIRAAMRGL
jgi:hypothetical protein